MTIRHLKTARSAAARDEDDAKTRAIVEAGLKEIETKGDAAVREMSVKFDKYDRDSYRLSEAEIEALIAKVTPREMADIKFAQEQVRVFAQHQRGSMLDIEVETMPGVILGHKNIPVQSVGCYVPGGKFPMVASAHMSVATASVAKVPRIIAATPPFKGEPNPAVIAAMHLGGAHEIYVMGGIQAIGAMAIGTQTIDPVHMLVGPGNAYVAAAKRRVFGVVGIDMIAGPSEILVVGDGSTEPDWVAMDMFSQAEHDELAQAILLAPDAKYLDAVAASITRQLADMPRREVIEASLKGRGALI